MQEATQAGSVLYSSQHKPSQGETQQHLLEGAWGAARRPGGGSTLTSSSHSSIRVEASASWNMHCSKSSARRALTAQGSCRPLLHPLA